jgi:hypothetical protein
LFFILLFFFFRANIGRFKSVDGDIYEGQFTKKGRSYYIKGLGIFMFANGAYYEGEWENNMRHGLFNMSFYFIMIF